MTVRQLLTRTSSSNGDDGKNTNGTGSSTLANAEPDLAIEIAVDPAESARAAGLRYVSDTKPGIRREKIETSPEDKPEFRYARPDGSEVTDEKTLARIRSLGIPPAYQDVWIATDPRGHLQATGRDARGRKQYRYHAKFRETRDETKFGRMVAFGEALPTIRARVDEDLRRPGLPREKVLATLVRLLEETFIRVGNEEYARQNEHFGLTTLHDDHVAVEGGILRFHFTGKSGKEHEISVRDPRVAKIVKRSQELPGEELFQYVDKDGARHAVHSHDVNEYLGQISGEHFTAKDFRTWAGTLLCALSLRESSFESASEAKKNVVAAIKAVSERLGNTPAVCRKCYVHPAVLDTYLDGTLLENLAEQIADEAAAAQQQEENAATSPHALKVDEAAVMRLLRRALAQAREQTA